MLRDELGLRLGSRRHVGPAGLRTLADALRTAPGPAYGVPGPRPEIRGFGGSDDAVSHITFAIRVVEVDSGTAS